MANPAHPAQPRRRRGLIIALVLSLGLNFVVIGAVAGALMSGHLFNPPRGFDLSIGPFARALEPEDREWMMRRLLSDDQIIARDIPARRAEMERILAAISATPFDPAVAEVELEVMRAHGAEVHDFAMRAFIERLQMLDDSQRQAFAERLEAEFVREIDDLPRGAEGASGG